MTSEHVTSAYPIAASRSGRRRRMLAMQVSADFDVASTGVAVINSRVPVDPASESLPGQTPVSKPINTPAPPLVGDAARIQELLDNVQPRTWVFTGDNLGFDVRQARRGWVEHFSDFIQERLNRTQDMVLNSSIASSTIAGLRKDVEWRVLRFQPDVVLIMPSQEECEADGDRNEFRDALCELVDYLHEEGCTVVLGTPPCPAPAHSIETTNHSLKTAVSRIR
ncbi:MAG: hypothetical protein O3B86_16180, partial [Planctomycetota bacterium]|nr:hypothetical protein [Planctomycetota bacterium]